MNLLIRYCKGYVRVRLIGNMPERFLNLCAANQIFLWNLLSDEGSYLLSMSIQDFRRLKPLCRKSGCTLHIVEKHGMPSFFIKTEKGRDFYWDFFVCRSFCICYPVLSGIFMWMEIMPTAHMRFWHFWNKKESTMVSGKIELSVRIFLRKSGRHFPILPGFLQRFRVRSLLWK